MKSLVNYIFESDKDSSKSFSFDFNGINDAEDVVKSLKEYEDYVSEEDNKVTITITADNVEGITSVQDILQQFIEAARKDSKNSSDEQYAQKTKKLATALADMNDAIDELENPEEEGDDKGDGEDGKKEDE